MTEPIDVAIEQALFAQLSSPSIANLAIAWPLVDFTPVPGTPYLHVRAVLHATPEHLGIGFNASDAHRGVFQVDVVMPDGSKGAAPGLRIAAQVRARFAIGTALTAGGRKLQIVKKPTIAAAVMDAPWVRFPVSIPYLLFAQGV